MFSSKLLPVFSWAWREDAVELDVVAKLGCHEAKRENF
jgi:hypothetical protein